METKEITVDASGGARLDVYLASRLEDVSRSYIQKLIADGFVSVNGLTPRAGTKVAEGDEISVTFADPVPTDILPEDIPLDIRYDDDHIMVINKPKGMTVHPAPGSPTGTLVNAILACGCSLSSVGGVERPGIVHRIDKDTSGLIIAAKNDIAHASLSAQIKEHSARRTYLALCIGTPGKGEESGDIDLPIGRHPVDRMKMAVFVQPSASARNALTHWRVLERYKGYSLVECRLETGRTHQIRVHLSYTGHPVLGDPLYGGDGDPFVRRHPGLFCGQMLHACRIEFSHPVSGKRIVLEAPPPPEFSEAQRLLSEL
jgi:23S rRNA pseudouridine1911/1915/1917 synthase